jgi:hypothetical protein
MKVKKSRHFPEPEYPSRRQFMRYGAIIGAAALGVSAMASGCRTKGVIRTIDPSRSKSSTDQTNAVPTKQTLPDTRLRGDIAVDPTNASPPEPPPMPDKPRPDSP